MVGGEAGGAGGGGLSERRRRGVEGTGGRREGTRGVGSGGVNEGV